MRLQEKISDAADSVKTNSFVLLVQQNKGIFLISFGTLGLFGVLFGLGVFDLAAFLSAFIPVLITIPLSVWNTSVMGDRIKIMGLSMDYMLNRGGVTIDDILGILISYKLRQRIVEPTKGFFRAIGEICDYGTPEDRRRVAESLPALYRLNRKSTKEIIETKLRTDYDDGRWKDDNRRRTIESFWYFPKTREADALVKRMLSLKDRDSEFTIIAIMEIICLSNRFRGREKAELISRLSGEIREAKYSGEIAALAENIRAFSDRFFASGSGIGQRYVCIRDSFVNADDHMKVVCAKNILLISGGRKRCMHADKCQLAECRSSVIRLFDLCFDPHNHRYIRRPMAKEDVCFCLLSMLPTDMGAEARKRFMSLVKDSDPSIAISAFDYIHKILAMDTVLYNNILTYCLNLDKEPVWADQKHRREWEALRSRAEHVRDTVGFKQA